MKKVIIKSIPTQYGGVNFRSRLEARWAAFFDLLEWKWEYEPFDLDGWIPDFLINEDTKVLVEVKPIYKFEKIDKIRNEKGYENLLVGIAPFEDSDGHLSLGFLNEQLALWSNAIMGIWDGSESEKKNVKNRVGFCHSEGIWRDRITGCYDGGRFGRGNLDKLKLLMLWREAGNRVQWKSVASTFE